jgi:hypothetical protein
MLVSCWTSSKEEHAEKRMSCGHIVSPNFADLVSNIKFILCSISNRTVEHNMGGRVLRVAAVLKSMRGLLSCSMRASNEDAGGAVFTGISTKRAVMLALYLLLWLLLHC